MVRRILEVKMAHLPLRPSLVREARTLFHDQACPIPELMDRKAVVNMERGKTMGQRTNKRDPTASI